jgi:RNA polymerase sigma-70 factor (ECF subfamily)
LNLLLVTHLVNAPLPRAGTDRECAAAFQDELEYIHRTLKRFGAASAEVEDLAQDVFLALRQSWSQYDQSRPLRPYLCGIAFRLAAAYRRKSRREVAFGVVDTDDLRPSPEDVLHGRQARAVLLAALERIPLPRRAVLVMRDLHDVPVEEVALLLAIPRFTAYSRLRKARSELKKTVRRLLEPGDLPMSR